MKKIASIVIASLLGVSVGAVQASSAPTFVNQSFWSWSNLYVLGQTGWEQAQLDSFSAAQLATIPGPLLAFHTTDTGVAGRIALGYSLVPKYLDVQLGYTKYQNGYQNFTVAVGPEAFAVEGTTSLETADLSLEGKLPLNQFYLAGKVGGAYAHFVENVHDEVDLLGVTTAAGYSQTTNAFRPLVGVSIGYHVNTQVFAEIGYQYLFGRGNTLISERPVPDTQFASLGLGCYF